MQRKNRKQRSNDQPAFSIIGSDKRQPESCTIQVKKISQNNSDSESQNDLMPYLYENEQSEFNR